MGRMAGRSPAALPEGDGAQGPRQAQQHTEKVGRAEAHTEQQYAHQQGEQRREAVEHARQGAVDAALRQGEQERGNAVAQQGRAQQRFPMADKPVCVAEEQRQ